MSNRPSESHSVFRLLVKITWSSGATLDESMSLQTHRVSPERDVLHHGDARSLGAFAFSASGRALAQQTGECRRRRQESDGAFSAPAPAGLVTGTSTNRHTRPTRVWPTLTGRLQIECGPFGGGSHLTGSPEQMMAEGTIGSLGADHPSKQEPRGWRRPPRIEHWRGFAGCFFRNDPQISPNEHGLMRKRFWSDEMRWADFDTSTEEDRARVRKEREPKAWAVLDKIGSTCFVAYTEEEARSWWRDAQAEFRNKNESGPGYTVVPLGLIRPTP